MPCLFNIYITLPLRNCVFRHILRQLRGKLLLKNVMNKNVGLHIISDFTFSADHLWAFPWGNAKNQRNAIFFSGEIARSGGEEVGSASCWQTFPTRPCASWPDLRSGPNASLPSSLSSNFKSLLITIIMSLPNIWRNDTFLQIVLTSSESSEWDYSGFQWAKAFLDHLFHRIFFTARLGSSISGIICDSLNLFHFRNLRSILHKGRQRSLFLAEVSNSLGRFFRPILFGLKSLTELGDSQLDVSGPVLPYLLSAISRSNVYCNST